MTPDRLARKVRFPVMLSIPMPEGTPRRLQVVAEASGMPRAEWMRRALLAALADAEARAAARRERDSAAAAGEPLPAR